MIKLTSKGKKKVDKLINRCSVTYETIEQDIPLWVKDGVYENSFVNESMTKEIPVKLREYTDFINYDKWKNHSYSLIVSNIIWDADESEVKEFELPSEVKLNKNFSKETLNNDVADYLCDAYGFCPYSFTVDVEHTYSDEYGG